MTKLCECGCGEPTKFAPTTHATRGWIKGQPLRFIHNHHMKNIPLASKFWPKVDKHGPTMPHMKTRCWKWIGAVTDTRGEGGRGRGTIRMSNNQSLTASRVAFFLKHGRWPVPCALHHCDNPNCVRWSHLFEGNQTDNSADKMAKGRQAKGSNVGRAKLNTKQVIEIRKRVATGEMIKTLALEYGVCNRTISDIVRGKFWKHTWKGKS